MKIRLHFSRALIIAIVLSIGLHSIPVAYFKLSGEPQSVLNSEIEVELIAESSVAQSVQPAKTIATPISKGEKRAKTPGPPSISSKNQKADIFNGGFIQHHFDVLSTVTTDTAIGSTSAETDANPFPQDPMTNVRASGHGWSSAVQYGNSMGLQFTLETLGFFESLHARINSQLIYPDDFSKQRITGKVRIEAELGREGKLIRFTSTTADDRLLQTYCFAILVQILSQPLPERAWLVTERIHVAFDFEFHTRVRNNIPSTLPMAIEKNRLSFGRESEIDPWLNERLNEIFTHYIPPIIPIPGGFYIDMIAAYAYVNNLMNDAPTEREMRSERLTKFHELLRMALKVNGIAPRPAPTPLPDS